MAIFLLYPNLVERKGALAFLPLLIQGHQSCHRGSTFMTSSKPYYLPKATSSINIILGVRASSNGFWEDTKFQSIIALMRFK